MIPMTLMLCENCHLVQLKETVKPDLLYKEYFYRSNVSATMKRDLQNVVDDVSSRVIRGSGDKVLDIGCNDGLMMTMFTRNFNVWGIDPAENIEPVTKGLKIITDYFPASQLTGSKFSIITSTAMFYDLDNPNKAVKEIKKLLAPDGVVCIQVSYLYDTIHDMNFYDICHEHLEYYSLETLQYLMRNNGMKIFDASINAVNGGSIRIMVTHKNNKRKISPNIKYLLNREKMLHLANHLTYTYFAKIIDSNATIIRNFIKSQKGLVIALGASTKGNVLLQLCKLTRRDLPYISERNPYKVGLRNLGIDMELISEEAARKLKPTCMFIVPWNFKEEIVDRERAYIESGGKLLFIMPYPYILDKEGEHRL